PHVANYDAVLVVVAASVVVARGLADGFRRGELLIPLAAWMIQLFNPPTSFHFAVITPVLTALLIACAIARAGAAAQPVDRAALDTAPAVR
ncbi:MAG: hypothetical protein JO001_14055, partial [Alphaproteobacteria bacterium]|nr:hypothetical protein [Alphaproteobacteria bacterium]